MDLALVHKYLNNFSNEKTDFGLHLSSYSEENFSRNFKVFLAYLSSILICGDSSSYLRMLFLEPFRFYNNREGNFTPFLHNDRIFKLQYEKHAQKLKGKGFMILCQECLHVDLFEEKAQEQK